MGTDLRRWDDRRRRRAVPADDRDHRAHGSNLTCRHSDIGNDAGAGCGHLHGGLVGFDLKQDIARRGWALTATQSIGLTGRPDVAFIDLREPGECAKHGSIPGALHAPYGDLQNNIRAGGLLHELARANDRRIVFYCAYGERSAMAVQAAQEAGLISALHVEGGIDAWKRAEGPLTH